MVVAVRSLTRSRIWVASLAALIAVVGCAKQKDDRGSELEDASKVGSKAAAGSESDRRPAPDFSLRDLDGKEIRLSQFRGKVVILNFWATWCPPCRQEIPDLVDLQRQYQSQGLEIIGVSMDQEGAAIVRPFARQNRINYTMLVGGQSVAAAFGGIQGIPTTFVLDKQGRIADNFVGLRPRSAFENAAKSLLGEG